jgi:SAM-dependent methyltransferase
MTTAGTQSHPRERPFFADPVNEYADKVLGRPLALLRAGCLTPLTDLGLDRLPCAEFSVITADSDDPLVRTVLGEPASSDAILGDLRTAPLRPRTFDIVYCALLLERIANVEVVLDRLAGSLRPGGLMLLRFTDRESALGLLYRMLPRPARRAVWQRYMPGTPGPFPAVYEMAVSARGIHGYALMRGLVITARTTSRSAPVATDRITRLVASACQAISWVTRGRITAEHDELLYVIRKPEDRFARVVLPNYDDAA